MSNTIIMTMTIQQAFFKDSEQAVEDGEQITVQVVGGTVKLINPNGTEIRLTIQELHALYQFAILEAKQQGCEL